MDIQTIIKCILALPEITLSEAQWTDLSELMNSLDTINIDGVLSEIYKDRDPAIPKSPLDHQLNTYLTAWIELAHLISDWLKSLCTTWKLLHESELSADDLIPLLIELIPRDTTQLQHLQPKLAQASMLMIQSELGWAFTAFYSAFMNKLEQMQNPTSTDSNPINERIQNLILELQNQPLIETLKVYLEAYISKLRSYFLSNFSHYHKSLFDEIIAQLPASIDAPINDDDKMNAVIDHIVKNQIDISEHGLLNLNMQYNAALDLQQTVQRQTLSATQKRIEFSMKFKIYHELLLNKHDNNLYSITKFTTHYIGFGAAHLLFGSFTVSQQFLQFASHLCDQMPSDMIPQNQASSSSTPTLS